MPSWGAVAYGVALSGLVAIAAVRLALRERRRAVLVASGVAAALAPLLWDLILRHTGGHFFTDAPGVVFPVSYEDTGSVYSQRRWRRSCSGSARCAPRAASASR